MINWPPSYMAYITSWIAKGSPADNSTWGMWNANDPAISPSGAQQPGEGGVDLPVSIGTPVYALATGPVQAVGYWQDNAHGVLTQRVNVPGVGLEDLYYQHIQLNPSIKAGDVVQKGQQIGTIGPFNEIEMGFNAAWGGPWGGQWGSPGNAPQTANHPGPWIKDPRPWLAALVSGNPAPVSGSGLSTSSTGVGSSIAQALGLPTPAAVQSMAQRVMLVFFGGLIILIGVLVVFFSSDAGKKTVKAGEMAAMA